MEWIWGCMVILAKGTIGMFFWIFAIIIASAGLATIGWVLTKGFPEKPKEKETWQEWEKEEKKELKSLLDEIDKDINKTLGKKEDN